MKDRVKIIESNKNFTVSIIDGTIRVKELSREVKASKVSFWSHRFICYLALIPLSLLFVYGFPPFAAALWYFSYKVDEASQQLSAWEANLSEDIAQLRQYVFAGGERGIIHCEDLKHKQSLIATVVRKYPGFSSHFCYACLGKNGFKRLSEGDHFFKPSKKDPWFCTFTFGGYLKA